MDDMGTLALFCSILLATLYCSCSVAIVPAHQKQNLTVGFLTAVYGGLNVKNRQGLTISGAISYAIKKINDDPEILPDHHVQLIWADTEADTLTGLNALTEQWRSGAAAFFGPEDSCVVEARVAAAWNLPMISYVSCFYVVL